MQTDRCTDACERPCAKDHRTKAEKIAAVVRGGSTPGERAAATAAQARVKPEPVKLKARPNATASSSRPTEVCPHGIPQFEGSRRCNVCDPPVRWEQDFFARFSKMWDANIEEQRETLRKVQAKETLRRAGIKMPDEPGFETEYTYQASQASETFRRASERVSQASNARDAAKEANRLTAEWENGTLSWGELQRRLAILKET